MNKTGLTNGFTLKSFELPAKPKWILACECRRIPKAALTVEKVLRLDFAETTTLRLANLSKRLEGGKLGDGVALNCTRASESSSIQDTKKLLR